MTSHIQLRPLLAFIATLPLVSPAWAEPASTAAPGSAPFIRIGLVGLDTSHVTAFTGIFNDARNPEHVPGAKVVVGFKGGSPDIQASASRVEGFVARLKRDWDIEIVSSIPELCSKVDGVLITSVDGRPHLEQARQVIAAGKPMFIDKPMAASLKDALEIARQAKAAGVPWFGGSSLRWTPALRQAIQPEKAGRILGCDAYSPCALEPHHPDLSWYGVHGVEILYAVMGKGCQTVTRVSTADTDLVVGVWADGRVGTFRGTRKGLHEYGATVFGTRTNAAVQGHGMKGLAEEIVRFFQTRKPPVDPEEALEVIAFMEAADASKAQGGKAVPLSLIH